MGFKEFFTWFFAGSVALLFAVLGYFGSQSLDELRNIRKEMTELNIKLVLVVSNQEHQDKRLDKLESRVDRLETKQ